MRSLSNLECKSLLIMANSVLDSVQREQLIHDLQSCLVEEQVNGEILFFHLQNYSRPKYEGQHQFQSVDGFPVEGIISDANGNEIAVWLFADSNNRILELELNNYTGNIPLPVDWSTFRLN